MRRYQRGIIVALLGLMATTLVKLVGIQPRKSIEDGWHQLAVSDIQRDK